MTACLPNESIFLLLMLCIYTHCNLPYKPQRRERESERERASESQRECERRGASAAGSGREGRPQTKPSSQTAASPPSPLRHSAARLRQQQVQGCRAEAAAEERWTGLSGAARREGAERSGAWLHLSYFCGRMLECIVSGGPRNYRKDGAGVRASTKRRDASAIPLRNLRALAHAGKV